MSSAGGVTEIPHLRHYRERRPLHNRHSCAESPSHNRHSRAGRPLHLRHSRAGGNPGVGSPARKSAHLHHVCFPKRELRKGLRTRVSIPDRVRHHDTGSSPSRRPAQSGGESRTGSRVARTVHLCYSARVQHSPCSFPISLSVQPARNTARHSVLRCPASDRANCTPGVPSTRQVFHPPDTNGTNGTVFGEKSGRRP